MAELLLGNCEREPRDELHREGGDVKTVPRLLPRKEKEQVSGLVSFPIAGE